jgi:hypothetical protein
MLVIAVIFGGSQTVDSGGTETVMLGTALPLIVIVTIRLNQYFSVRDLMNDSLLGDCTNQLFTVEGT